MAQAHYAESAGDEKQAADALVEQPSNDALDEFKHQVKMWMDMDNTVKKYQQVIREKRTIQRVLSEKILEFMARYNIEDLNTKEGKLRYAVSNRKPAVKKTDIKNRLINCIEDKDKAQEIARTVFGEDSSERVQKVSLRRLKSVRVMNM